MDHLILLIALIGNLEFLIFVINRLHAVAIPHGPWRWLRERFDLTLFLLPCVSLCVLVTHWNYPATEILKGNAPAYCLIFSVTGFLGFAGLIRSIFAWHARKAPPELKHEDEQIFDTRDLLSEPLIGPGPGMRLARLPGNELLQLSVTRKTLVLPSLPEAWDGLRITHLSDLHYSGTIRRPYFEQVMKQAQKLNSDINVFTGDLIDDESLMDWIGPTLGQLEGRFGNFFILGNHDWDHSCVNQIRETLESCGWEDTAGRVLTRQIHGQLLVLGGSECPWMGSHPDFHAEKNDHFRLFLCHSPDYLDFAAQQGVDLMLSGHVHGGQIILPLIGPVLSPSLKGTRFSHGVFRQSRTLLHVTRGISAKHSLRWRCRPELTQLILHCHPR